MGILKDRRFFAFVFFLILFFVIKNTKVFILNDSKINPTPEKFFSLNIRTGILKKVAIDPLKKDEITVKINTWGIENTNRGWSCNYASGVVISENVDNDFLKTYDDVLIKTKDGNVNCSEYINVKSEDVVIKKPNFISDEQIVSVVPFVDEIDYLLKQRSMLPKNPRILVTSPGTLLGTIIYSYFKDIPGIEMSFEKSGDTSKLKEIGIDNFVDIKKDLRNSFDAVYFTKHSPNSKLCSSVVSDGTIFDFGTVKSCEKSVLFSSGKFETLNTKKLDNILSLLNSSKIMIFPSNEFHLNTYQDMLKKIRKDRFKAENILFTYND